MQKMTIVLGLILIITAVATGVPRAGNYCEELGGVQIGHQCLKFHDDQRRTFEGAKAHCASSGSQLASLQDPVAVIEYKNANYDGGTHFFVGGSDALNEGTWKWLNGKSLDASFPWGDREPSGDGDCLLTWGTGTYNDVGCHSNQRFICELDAQREPQRETVITPTAKLTCVYPGAKIIGGQCLLFNGQRKDWNGAVEACKASGGALASLQDLQAFNDYGRKHFGSANRWHGWVGATDAAKEGWFVWLNGQPLQNYDDVPWDKHEPNGFTAENCLWYDTYIPQLGFRDADCSSTDYFVCDMGGVS